MSDLIIRAAERSDAPALARLFNQPSYRHGTLRLPYETIEAVETRLFDQAGANVLGLVGEFDGVLVGSAGLTRWFGRRAHVGTVGLGVDEAYRRRRIGRRLLEAVIDSADNWLGLRRLELSVNVDNAPAISLYTSLGFETEGRERQSILRDGHLVDSYRMARLREAPSPLPRD